MKAVLRQTILALLAVAGVYGALAVTAFFVHPRDLGRPVAWNNQISDKILFDRAGLHHRGRRVILFGASNMLALDRDLVSAALDGQAVVHSMVAPASNIGQIRSAIDVVFEELSPAELKDTVLVMGLWYGSFLDDRTRWNDGPNGIDTEKLKYAMLYRQRPTGRVVPTLPPSLFPQAGAVLLPLRVLYAARKRLIGGVQSAAFETPRDAEDVELRHRTQLEIMAGVMHHPEGEILDEQFRMLSDLLRRISASGAKVLLIDLSIPRWHSQATPYFPTYQRKKAPIFAEAAALPGVHVVDWQGIDDDDLFIDTTHQVTSSFPMWVEKLKADLRKTGLVP